MKRLTAASSLLLLALSPTLASARADLDPKSASLRIESGALRTYDFERPESLMGLQLTLWADVQSFLPKLERTPITNVDQVKSMLVEGTDVVEGTHALRLGKGGYGLAIVDPALFGELARGRFEVTFWARADGAVPQLHVVYDRSIDNVYAGNLGFATVRGIRTGRETTDGWAEFAATPLDGSVWGMPVQAIAITPSAAADGKTSFLIDALEIRKVEGKIIEPKACTQQTAEAVCGAEGECMYGRCVSATATWGVLPSLAQRTEVAERWVQLGTRFIGDRNGAINGTKILLPNARAIAKTAVSSRQFYGGLNRLVNLLRDNHTSFGSPGGINVLSPQVRGGGSGVVGACFGVVEKDIAGGGLGYAVFRATETSPTGVPLKRGDLVLAIDGRDPKEWVDEMYPLVATTLPNDPAADWGPSANDLARLVSARASTLTIGRCASSAACTGSARQVITIDIAKPAFEAVTGDLTPLLSRGIGCTQRFSESVTAAAPPSSNEDPVKIETGAGGETRVSFDGFVGEKVWRSQMSSVFNGVNTKVLMDARMGHGGFYDTVEYLFNLTRGTSEPIGVFSMGRGTYDLVDPPWLLSRLGQCTGEPTSNADFWLCFQGHANGFYAKQASPPGASTRIAWVNTYDVSANDFMPRLLKGRTNVRIFGPHPTAGAFGAIAELPPLLTGYSGGSLQVQDARFSSDLQSAATARWESGHGVIPDTVVVEKLSHAIDGVDTMIEAATAWLASGSP